MSRKIEIKRIYRHFKGKHYLILNIAEHTETGEKLVIYQAMYGDFGIWARPYEMFAEEVESGRSDNTFRQKYRFELDEDMEKLVKIGSKYI